MARFVVPLLVLVAMVGGYVVGQQPDKKAVAPGESPNPVLEEQHRRDGIGVINDVDARTPTATIVAPVGRYIAADGGRMLDSTDGTLYAVSGDRWQEVAKLKTATEPAENSARKTGNIDGFGFEDPRKR
jgi:hypothetical protein